MNEERKWDVLFKAKLLEVTSKKSKWYHFATLTPTANGNCAREQIAEEYYAQADTIAALRVELAHLNDLLVAK